PSRIRICRGPASACSWRVSLAVVQRGTIRTAAEGTLQERSEPSNGAGARDPTATAILPEPLNLTSVPAGGLAGKPLSSPPINQVAQRTTATLLGVGQWSLGSSDVEPIGPP